MSCDLYFVLMSCSVLLASTSMKPNLAGKPPPTISRHEQGRVKLFDLSGG